MKSAKVLDYITEPLQSTVLLATSDVKLQLGAEPAIFCVPLQIYSSAFPSCSLPLKLIWTTPSGPLAFWPPQGWANRQPQRKTVGRRVKADHLLTQLPSAGSLQVGYVPKIIAPHWRCLSLLLDSSNSSLPLWTLKLLPNSSADTSPLIPLQSHIFVNSPFIKLFSNNPNLSMQFLVEILIDGGILLLAAKSSLSVIPSIGF